MTKEKLEKEAHEKWWDEDTVSGASTPNRIFVAGYLAGAGPREEQIAHLEKRLIDVSEKSVKRFNELEAKIEEMKRDVNECFGYEYNILVAKLLNKWEIKEK